MSGVLKARQRGSSLGLTFEALDDRVSDLSDTLIFWFRECRREVGAGQRGTVRCLSGSDAKFGGELGLGYDCYRLLLKVAVIQDNWP